MGDKSPKSKERNQKQRSAARAEDAAAAKVKREGYTHAPAVPGKNRK